MKIRTSKLLTIPLLMILFSISPKSIFAVPSQPHLFWGNVKVNQQNVEQGTQITAYILDGNTQIICGQTQTISNGTESSYAINVKGDDSETSEKEGASQEDIVYFKINSQSADQTSSWQPAQVTNLNLTTTVQDSTPTNTPTPNPSSDEVSILMKFQGINKKGNNHNISIAILQGGTQVERFENLEASSDENGIYSANIEGITPGNYNIYIKGWAHLQKKFENVSVPESGIIDLTGQEILSGNSIDSEESPEGPNPGRINISDFSILARDYQRSGSNADFNDSGLVDIADFSILASNYGKTGDEYWLPRP